MPGNVMAFAEPSVQHFSWPHATPYTEDDARSFFAFQDAARRRGEALNLAFVRPHEPRVVLGGGSIYDVDFAQRRAAVGYWLARDARGRGIATNATRLMAGWAFEALDLARLELTCAPENEPSQHVAERCGFVREGLLRSHIAFKGGRRDTLMFSLLPGELR